MQQSNAFFATAKPVRLFFTVAMPGMVSMLAASIYSIVEGVFIGQLIGEAAFAAVNIAMPFVMINFSLADLIGVGSSAPIAIALGKKDGDRANNIFTCSLIMIVLAAVVMGALLFFLSPALVKLNGAEGELASLAVRYVRVYALMGPVTTVVFAMDNYLRISGFVKTSMLLNIFMTALTAVFLFLFLGLAKMNVEGSALSASLAMATCAILALVPFIRKKTVLRFVKPKFSIPMIRQIVACGTPVFLNNIAGRVASIVINAVLLYMGGEEYGQTAVAAYAVLMYAGAIIEPLLYGMADSVQPAIGYNWGARSFDRVKKLTKCAFTGCCIVSVLGAVAMFLLPDKIAWLFVEEGEVNLMQMAVRALRLFAPAFLFRWAAFAAQGFYSAIEKPLPASIISVCNACVVPLIFIAALWPLNLDGVWLNMVATSAVVLIMAFVMLRLSQKRIKKEATETQEKGVRPID